MNTKNMLDKIRSAASVVISLAKLGVGATQLVFCAGAALVALGIAGLEDRSLVVAGQGLSLWPSSFFYVLSALQACCALQGASMAGRVLERGVLAVVSFSGVVYSSSASIVEVQSTDTRGPKHVSDDLDPSAGSDGQPGQSASQATEATCL